MARNGEEELTGEDWSLVGFPWRRCLSRRRDLAAKLRGATKRRRRGGSGVATEGGGVRARSVPAECTVRACARKKKSRSEACEEEEEEADGLYL